MSNADWQPKVFRGNLGDVDLRLLRVFRVVVECGGFTAAEIALGTGKSSISKHLADLEIRLGVRLCRRGRSGFALTAEGDQVYRATLQLFTSLEDFKARVNAVNSRLVGTLALGFVDTIVTDESSPLVGALAQYRRIAPEVDLRVSVGSTTDIERGVLDGTLHVGIVLERAPVPGLSHRMLYDEKSLLFCSSGHPLFARPDESITSDELSSCAFVKRSYTEDEHATALKGIFNSAATADHVEAVATLILTGGFIGFLPEHYAASWVSRGKLRALAPKAMNYYTHFTTITRKGAPRPTVVDLFVRELEKVRDSLQVEIHETC